MKKGINHQNKRPKYFFSRQVFFENYVSRLPEIEQNLCFFAREWNLIRVICGQKFYKFYFTLVYRFADYNALATCIFEVDNVVDT
jgi:hypothetical protein